MHALKCLSAVCLLILFLPRTTAKTAKLSVPAQVSTGCHGNTHGDFLTPACANQTIIAVSGVYAMVKKTDTGCPEAATASDRDEEKCCTYNTRDCKLLYLASEMSFYEDCTGIYTCNMKVATQLTQGCNDVGYLLRSNYMMMEYFCVPRSLTLEGVEDASVSDTSVYLKSKGYPAGIPAGTEVRCSVSASCDTPVVITAIHVDLQNDSTGTCKQRLKFKGNNEEMQIDCDSNNGDTFMITEAFTSKSHFLVIRFLNTNSGNTGRYWLEIKAEANGATVEMTCGNDAASTPTTVDKCADNPDHSERPANVTEDPIMSKLNTYKTATIGLGVCLGVCLVFAVIMIVCVCKYWKDHGALKWCNKGKVMPSNSATDSGGPQGRDSTLQEHCAGGNGYAPTGSGLPPLSSKQQHTDAGTNSSKFNEHVAAILK